MEVLRDTAMLIAAMDVGMVQARGHMTVGDVIAGMPQLQNGDVGGKKVMLLDAW